jgi:hypothetical protein
VAIQRGASGFLYGLGNAGIPSANILVPLKLNVAAQKPAGGFQHLNGDALNGAGLPKSISVCPIDEPSFQYYSHFIMKVKGAKLSQRRMALIHVSGERD